NTVNGAARNVSVHDGGNLTVDGTLLIQEDLVVRPSGNFTVNNNASLVQIDNVPNTGNGTVNRNTTTTSSSAYVYWSSPVENFNLSGLPGNLTFSWIPTMDGTYYGNWVAASGTMDVGKGYIKRAGATGTIATSFSNRLNNGYTTIPITRGTYN